MRQHLFQLGQSQSILQIENCTDSNLTMNMNTWVLASIWKDAWETENGTVSVASISHTSLNSNQPGVKGTCIRLTSSHC